MYEKLIESKDMKKQIIKVKKKIKRFRLLKQVQKVIPLLELRIKNGRCGSRELRDMEIILAIELITGHGSYGKILDTLYERYKKAEKILSENEDIEKIMIIGGCRAYRDSFSDDNPLLEEMGKAERLLEELEILEGKKKRNRK